MTTLQDRCALRCIIIILLMPGQGSMGIVQILLVRCQVTPILVLLQLCLQLHHHTTCSVHDETSITSGPHRYEGSITTKHFCAEAADSLIEVAVCNLRLQSMARLVRLLIACTEPYMKKGRSDGLTSCLRR